MLVTMILMLALRPLAFSIDLVDKPGGRKRHVGDVPVVGGIAMFGGLIVGWALMPAGYPHLVDLGIAAGLLVTIGLLDDRLELPTVLRFGAQVAAVLIMVYGANIRLETLGNPLGFGDIRLGIFSLAVTLLVAVSTINAFNMVDGVDGLAGTMGLIALASVAVVAGYGSVYGMHAIIGLTVVTAFLIFNFPTPWNRRVRTFMGDAGSTMMGLLIVWVTMAVSQGPGAITTPVICLWFAAMPIYDLFTCFVLRIRKGHSPFRPGRDHFHHVLQRAGVGTRGILGILTGLQLIYANIGLVAHFAGAGDTVMFIAWALLGIFQRRMICLHAKLYRLDHRRRRARKAAEGATHPPGQGGVA